MDKGGLCTPLVDSGGTQAEGIWRGAHWVLQRCCLSPKLGRRLTTISFIIALLNLHIHFIPLYVSTIITLIKKCFPANINFRKSISPKQWASEWLSKAAFSALTSYLNISDYSREIFRLIFLHLINIIWRRKKKKKWVPLCLWPFQGSPFFHTACRENCTENSIMSKKGSPCSMHILSSILKSSDFRSLVLDPGFPHVLLLHAQQGCCRAYTC